MQAAKIFQKGKKAMTVSLVRSKIMDLFRRHAEIHMDVCCKSNRTHLENAFAVITAVHRNLFTVRITEDGIEKSYTFQYVDLLTNLVHIRELDNEDS